MELKIEGMIIEIGPEESGTSKTGKEWKKQGFVIKTLDQYPNKVAFGCFGDKIEIIERIITAYKAAEKITVFFNLSSREYNGRWFHSIDAWKVDVPQVYAVAKQEVVPEPEANGSNLPF